MVEKEKPVTVCVVMGSHWAAVMGGAQYQVKCIVEELLQKTNFRIIYLARSVSSTYKPKGYQIIKIADNSGIRKYGYLFDAFRLRRILKKIKPDVIYQRGLKSYTGVLAHYAKRNRCKFIFHIAHDYDVKPDKSISIHSLLQPIEKAVGEFGIRNANCIIAQTNQQNKCLMENYGRNDAIIIQNFHPMPTEKIEKSDKSLKVVWVANFKPMKRPELFVRLANDLSDLQDVEFIMVGRRGSDNLYKSLHEQISNIKNIKYLGEKTLDDVNLILAESHLFVNTSIAEGFPNTFIQAWMRKVPVISVSVNADGALDDNAIGICGRTYEGMRDAVKLLIEKKDLREKLGDAAQLYAKKHYSMENVEKLVSLMH